LRHRRSSDKNGGDHQQEHCLYYIRAAALFRLDGQSQLLGTAIISHLDH
jgi:hypothetical protein